MISLNIAADHVLTLFRKYPACLTATICCCRIRNCSERQNDEYPDTYCPSNEASYDLLFDVLDEVIEVFEPAQINIGHDEAYTFCKCRKCAEKDPVQVFVDDVLRIRAYLAQRGVGTIMWADKLLDARVEGKPCGGAHILKDYDDKEFIEEIPPIFNVGCMLPNDISMFHWYWGPR